MRQSLGRFGDRRLEKGVPRATYPGAAGLPAAKACPCEGGGLLLTTHEVASFAAARKIARFYRARWTIEPVNRTMKTEGFRIEASRVAEGGPLENLAAATLIAAVQVMQLVGDRDGTVRRPLEDVFDSADQPALEAVCATLEGKIARQENPHKRGSLAYATWVCARPGAWTGDYGKPGPIVIPRCLPLFKAMRHGWRIGTETILRRQARKLLEHA
jgi:hypothetical protein